MIAVEGIFLYLKNTMNLYNYSTMSVFDNAVDIIGFTVAIINVIVAVVIMAVFFKKNDDNEYNLDEDIIKDV